MAWTAPMTAVANAVFTAAQFNTHVRDNLLETAPGKDLVDNGYFVGTGANSIRQSVMAANTVATVETYTSSTYGNLATTGPAVTVTTGTAALIHLKASITSPATTTIAFMGYQITGASAVSAVDTEAIASTTTSAVMAGGTFLVTGLTAGSNTFTAKYRNSANTGNCSFANRDITVMPL